MTHTPSVEDRPAGPLEAVPAVEADRAPRWRPHRSPWLPGLTVTALTAATLSHYGVSAADMARFAAYVAAGLALPGTLLVRALYAGARTRAEEVALGLAIGYAVEVLCYMAARTAGAPLLVLAWPVTVVAAFLAVPRLRRHWRSPAGLERTPLWASWSLALLMAFLVAWGAAGFFRTHALTWPGLGVASVDMPFHLALVGELRHHMPPTVPMVAGEPLLYHWFVYAHYAAASWVTGVEPLVLLFRLGALPMLAVLLVLICMTGRRVTGSWAGGPLAAAGTLFVAVPSLYLGTNGSFTWGGVTDLAWASPTQTFGAMLFAPLVVILADLLEGRRSAGGWVLACVLLVAVMGGKASYLPLLGAGLVTVAAAGVIRRRRPPWPALAALGVTGALCLYAQTMLFGGARQGLIVSPLFTMRTTLAELTGTGEVTGPAAPELPSAGAAAGIALVYLLGWLVVWGGTLGLLSRAGALARPGVVLMLGMGAAGLGTMTLFGHPCRSQLFFLWGAYPYMVIVTVHGILLLLRRSGVSLRATLLAAATGTAAVYAIALSCGVRVPLPEGRPVASLYLPYVALAALAVVAGVVLTVRAGALRAWALVTVMLAAIGLPADLHARVLASAGRLAGGADVATAAPAPAAVPDGILPAARWLRAHSGPDDVVATNAHCQWGKESPCASYHFWVAALSERRVLVEGWAYTAANLRRWDGRVPLEYLPFWDARLIRLNDAAFTAPSREILREMRDRHGVRWLFADEHLAGDGLGIGGFARPVYRSGDYAVYDLAALAARAL
ncbi:hypothetical protein ABZT47_11720 [Sphaerisporangium sp. NPDC005289]|uniref:hypothetical protein n=1 Tax=Sphaerisporangium sp. NPDC005289 TaxID=3155247 RepID=UPI0033AEBA86